MPRPFVLVQLSDPHIGADWGIGDPTARLEAAVAAAAGLEPDAVVVTGDLADHADAAELEQARELLARLGAPVHVLPGNHDGRGALRGWFELPGAGDEPILYDAEAGPLRLLVVDTMRPGRDDGELDGERLRWLDKALAAAPETPTIVAMHHPPIATGVPAADAAGIDPAGRRGLAGVIARHPQVRRLIAGHVHRAVTGELAGRAVVTAPSTYVQMRLDLASMEMQPVPEPLGFTVHVVHGDEIASHVQPFADGAGR